VLFGAIVVAAVTALVAAVVGLFPRTEHDLNFNNLVAVAAAYQRAIDYRVRWARIATIALVFALVLGLAVFFVARANPTSAISATWDGSGTRLLLDAKATHEKLPDDAHVTVAIAKLDTPPGDLGTTIAAPGKNGTTSSELKIPLPDGVKRVRITSTIGWGDFDGEHGRYRHHHVDQVDLTVPPFTSPPAK
jgi:hypothetical protein